MKIRTYILTTTAIVTLFFSCKQKNNCIDSPNVSSISANVEMERLDQSYKTAKSLHEVSEITNEHPVVASQFLFADQYPNDSLFAQNYFNLLHDHYIDSLFLDVDRVFGDASDIQLQFQEAFQRIKYYYPGITEPKLITMVTGFTKDSYINDSLIIVGLDYYLGEGAKYRPKQYDYILKRFQKPYLVPQILLMYSDFFNNVDSRSNTALTEMIYYGKAMQFVKEMMPCVPDSLITGYTAEETADIDKNENVIWASMLQNEFLFETSNMIKTKIIGESPKTYVIGEKCPGRIGRWIGWRIIQSYRKNNPDVPLQELMENSDAQAIFNASGYKPS